MIRKVIYLSLGWLLIIGSWGLSGCQSMQTGSKPGPMAPQTRSADTPRTLAVWDLENLNPAELEEFNLGELLAVKVMEAFEQSDRWTLVERKDLLLALEEQNLGSSALASEDTRLKIGQLLGANAMVFGSYMKFMQRLQLNLRLVEVETGQILRATEASAPFSNNIGAVVEMAQKAAEDLQH